MQSGKLRGNVSRDPGGNRSRDARGNIDAVNLREGVAPSGEGYECPNLCACGVC